MSLPTLVCLKSEYNSKYLRYRTDDVITKGLIQASGETVMDPRCQYEVVDAKNWPALVHIKSRYNGRYLTRWSPDESWIGAAATEPIEDLTTWSCTLFRPFPVEGETNKIRLVHQQLGRYVRIRNDANAPYDLCLDARSAQVDNTNPTDVFNVFDLEKIYQISRNIAIKGDNGMYLGPGTFLESLPGLQFSYDDPNDPKIIHEALLSPDGTICFKSKFYGKFWRLGRDDLIVVDQDDDPRRTNDSTALFRQTTIDDGDNIIVLLNLKNNRFVKRYTFQQASDTLSANGDSVDEKFAHLQVIYLDE